MARLENIDSVNSRKQIISLLIIIGLLVGAWWAFAAVPGLIFGTKRYDQQDKLSDTTPIQGIPMEVVNPEWQPPDNIWDLFPDLNGDGIPDIPDWLSDFIADGNNLPNDFGSFDNLAQLNQVIFRIYPNGNSHISESDIWRLTGYDFYDVGGWSRSDTSETPLEETIQPPSIPYNQYIGSYDIRMPFGQTTSTSVGLPVTFPYPRIVSNSIDVTNELSTSLLKSSENGTKAQIQINPESAGNVTYTILKESINDESYWQTVSTEPINAPTNIKNKYLQFPGGSLQVFRNARPEFDYHYGQINVLISNAGATTTYDIASIIRNYLETNFEVDTNMPPIRPASDEDQVEWFLERGSGLPMDFATAFVMFTRAFGIPSRYGSGYNSLFTTPIYDPGYNREGYEFKFSNLYAWNEIYFTSSGGNKWFPFLLSPDVAFPFDDPNFDFPNTDLPTGMEELMSGNDTIPSDIGGFDNYGQLNTPAFRVYPQGISSVVDSDLWRISAFDTYLQTEWTRSDDTDYSLSQISSGAPYDNLYKIKVPFGNASATSIALPSCFTSPRIEAGSITATSLSNFNLYHDSEEGVKIGLHLTQTTSGNVSYRVLEDDPRAELYWAGNSEDPSAAPQSIKDKYLQIPGGLSNYLTNNPNFNSNYILLNGYMAGNSSFSSYEKANVIRTYLESVFEPDMAIPSPRPAEGEDVIEWFLGRGRGVPSDFAAAFVMFCRAFNIPSRFAVGYNSYYTQDEIDPVTFETYRSIHFSNLYAWNEIYFTDGGINDEFYPLIVSPSVTLPGGDSGSTDAYLNIKINGTYGATYYAYRGQQLEFNFELSNPDGSGGNDNASKTITIVDHVTEETLGYTTTNSNGYATYIINMDSNSIAGAHIISATQSATLRNISSYVLRDALSINLQQVFPNNIEKTTTNTTNVQAYIYDPISNQRVKNALLTPILVDSGNPILGSFSPSLIRTDANGAINENIDVQSIVDQGFYEFRVDFNGSYEIDHPFNPGVTVPISDYSGYMDTSSNSIGFTITDLNQKYFDLYINYSDPFYEVREDETAIVKRVDGSLSFAAYLEEAGSPVSGNIYIYDKTYSDTLVTTFTSGVSGWGYSSSVSISTHNTLRYAGVHELYGIWRDGGGNPVRLNQSFYIVVDEPMYVTINTVNPNAIYRTGVTPNTFLLTGYLRDSLYSTSIASAQMNIHLLKSGSDYGRLLESNFDSDPNISPVPILTTTTGYSRTYGIDSSAPLGEYVIRVDFNGTWNLNGYLFSYSPLSFSSNLNNKITIMDENDFTLEFIIDSNPTQINYLSSNAPVYQRNDFVLLEAILTKPGGVQESGDIIKIYDDRNWPSSRHLYTGTTDNSGKISTIIQLNNTYTAGLIRLKVQYGSITNYTQIFLNDTIEIQITNTIDLKAVRGVDTVDVVGYAYDPINNKRVKSAQLALYVESSTAIDITNQLTGATIAYTSSSDGQFIFSFEFSVAYGHHGDYFIEIQFYGIQQDSFVPCQAYFDSNELDYFTSQHPIKVYAGTQLVNVQYSGIFEPLENIIVTGDLLYDNGTAIASQQVNVTFEDGTGNLCRTSPPPSYGVETTSSGGAFIHNHQVNWISEDNVIFAEFYTDDGLYLEGTREQASQIL